jgi:hypothetical protein
VASVKIPRFGNNCIKLDLYQVMAKGRIETVAAAAAVAAGLPEPLKLNFCYSPDLDV